MIKQNRTKIVATIGPASASEKVLRSLVEAGMDVARFNFSHGEYDLFEGWLKILRAISVEKNQPIAVLQDLQGPRIRVGGDLPKEGVTLKDGEVVGIGYGAYRVGFVPIDYPGLLKDIGVGSRILLVDGLIELQVVSVSKTEAQAKVVIGGDIFPHKGVNIPNGNLSISALTEKDKKDLQWGLKNGVDYIALSFVRKAEDIKELKELIKKYKPGSPVRIIAKIEMHEAVDNILSILREVDGIMVARGDLGIEMPAEDVPVVQKKLILAAIEHGKPVITATQMMESMMENPRPTRAEVSDVANAVLDGTDAVMLSGETAGGQYPVEVVQMMTKIITKVEKEIFRPKSHGFENFTRKDLEDLRHGESRVTSADVLGASVEMVAAEMEARHIVVATHSGYSARMVAKDRPKTNIIALSPDEIVVRQLALVWGVRSYYLPFFSSTDELMAGIVAWLKTHKLAKKKEIVAIVTAHPLNTKDHNNLIKVQEIS
ncbi:MAG: pyruvate kinase [Patescibacteria group bacterium]